MIAAIHGDIFPQSAVFAFAILAAAVYARPYIRVRLRFRPLVFIVAALVAVAIIAPFALLGGG